MNHIIISGGISLSKVTLSILMSIVAAGFSLGFALQLPGVAAGFSLVR